MQDPVGLAVADRAQHDRLGLQRAGTRPCGSRPARRYHFVKQWRHEHHGLHDRSLLVLPRAKALLEQRGLEYEEINLAKDPEGRARARRAHRHDDLPPGRHRRRGRRRLQELVQADRAGRACASWPRRRGLRRAARRRAAAGAAGSARRRRSPAPRPRTSRPRRRSAGHGSPSRRWTRNSSWKDPRTPSAWRKSSIVAPAGVDPRLERRHDRVARAPRTARGVSRPGRAAAGGSRARNSASSA